MDEVPTCIAPAASSASRASRVRMPPAAFTPTRGLSAAQVVSALAPKLGGPAIVMAQNAVQQQARDVIGSQAAKVEQQAAEIQAWAEYAEQCERQVEALQDYCAQAEQTIAARDAEIRQLQATIARMRRGLSE